MVAEVFWGRQLEQIGIESRHLWLNMVEKVGLYKVAAVNSDRDFFEKLIHCHVL